MKPAPASIGELSVADSKTILRRPSRLAWLTIPSTALLSLVSLLVYLGYRLRCIVAAEHLHRTNLILAWIFFAVELCGLLPNSLAYLARSMAVRAPLRPQLSVKDEEAPLVDVYITCCGEDVDEILNTVRATCALDYPTTCFRVFILDDAASAELEKAIEPIRKEYGNLYYTARTKGPVKDYKAGNLNHGLAYSATAAFPAPLVAGLDADMIPEPNWLRAIVPHLLADPTLGMACPPQLFYNLPSPDTLSQDLTLWHRIMEVFADALGMANCTGSGWVMRRQALHDIGGFPTDTLAEDTKSSALMLGMGWKTALIQEPLQRGRVPDSIRGHIKQRTRWFIGHVQNAVQLRFMLFGQHAHALTVVQRIAGVAEQLSAVLVLLPGVAYVSVPLALLSGYPFVIWSTDKQLVWLMRAVSAHQLCSEAHRWSLKVIIDFRDSQTSAQIEGWLLPYYAVAFAQCFVLPTWLGGRHGTFSASGTVAADLHERDMAKRAPFWRRLWTLLYTHMAWVHACFVLACLTGVALNLARSVVPIGSLWIYTDQHDYAGLSILVPLLTRIGWPPAIWLVYTSAALKPLIYIMFPPTDQGLKEPMGLKGELALTSTTVWTSKSIVMGWYEWSKSWVASCYCVALIVVSFYL